MELVEGEELAERPMIHHACFTVDDFDVDRIFGLLKDYGVEPLGEAGRATGPLPVVCHDADAEPPRRCWRYAGALLHQPPTAS